MYRWLSSALPGGGAASVSTARASNRELMMSAKSSTGTVIDATRLVDTPWLPIPV